MIVIEAVLQKLSLQEGDSMPRLFTKAVDEFLCALETWESLSWV